MPTQKCNCNCTYCYIPATEKKKQGEYTFFNKALEQFIDELLDSGFENEAEIRFIGGEPYLELESIAKLSNLFLKQLPSGKIIINTNGTLIRKDMPELFAKKHFKQIIHIVSLDGLENVHNARRKLVGGENSFRKALEGIRILQESSMPVYINMVLDNQTIEEVNDFMRFLKKELGINELSVSLLYDSKKPLSGSDKYRLLEQVYRYSATNDVFIGGHHRLLLGAKMAEFKCRAGEKTILLSGDQKIYACQRFVGREEAEIFSSTFNFSANSCSSCVEKNCYSVENMLLGQKILELYMEKYPKYLRINDFDKILFGVL